MVVFDRGYVDYASSRAYPRLAPAVGGAHSASLTVHKGELYIAISDLARNDIHVWKLNRNYRKAAELKLASYLASLRQTPMNLWTPRLLTDVEGNLRLFHGGTVILNNGQLQTDIFTTYLPVERFQ